ncbi:WYL domain-containing protein [Marinobacter confluentis]|uniref:WYL domain-containing protein n=1 Tax=Marinobacter confluentis TaxID=1697557 RepID=A0A4Z1BPI3_9GAMM|nr:WYL domain-containing protein [Marinobacter confluentis]TGN39397.1 WYL domain-containing protein [Marinobacter confluentis]
MKKTDWPIRWDLLLRYRLIEIIALWEGRLTTNHICHSFGIGRQQASKDINTYLRELAPGNLVYDRHLKGYVPSDNFKPQVTTGQVSEYQDLLARQDSLSNTFESLDLSGSESTILRGPQRIIRPEVMRAVVAATRQTRLLKAEYASLSPARTQQQTLEPHTLVCVGNSWHLRAWCDKNREFRDFSLSRFRGTPAVMRQKSRNTQQQDDDWNRHITIVLMPDSRLNADQQEIIAADYGMQDHRMELSTRAALAPYLLSRMGLGLDHQHPDPMTQQIELVNEEQLGIGESARERSIKAVAGLS